MMFNRMQKVLALILVVTLVAPSALLVAPRPAHAFLGFGDIVHDPLNWVENAISAGANAITSSSVLGLNIKEYVLDPIAWALSQQMLQSVTGSVVSFVDGKGNGTGKPQFVTNLLGNLQGVGDNQAIAFLGQFGTQSNSPFASGITSALYADYTQKSSLAGFFASSKCTLGSASPNITSFLAGNWSKGGAAAWFALTTQDQNDPFTLYSSARGQLGSLITASQGARKSDIQNGGGFMSWCGDQNASQGFIVPATPNPLPPNINDPGAACPAGSTAGGDGLCYGTPTCPAGYTLSGDACTPSDTVANAGSCTKSDGTPGTMQTPGSVIHDQLSTTLGSGVGKLISADEIDEIIGQLAMSMVSSVLGGSSGGLSGVAQSSSANSRSLLDQYVSENASSSTSSTNVGSLAQSRLTDISNYEAAWNTILASAQTASSSVQSLIQQCSQSSVPRSDLVNEGQTALLTEVNPLVSKAQSALSSAETTRALANKVLSEANSTTSGAAGALLADSQALAAAPPSSSDVVAAQTDAQSTGSATSTPPGSLTVSGSTSVDQMNLIASNAQALASACVVFVTH